MKIPKLNIRQRLPLYISLSALFVLLLEGFLIYFFSLRFYEQRFKMLLQARLEQADSVLAKDRTHPIDAIQTLPPGGLPDEEIFYASDALPFLLLSGVGELPKSFDTSRLDFVRETYFHEGQRDFGIRHDPASHHTLVVSAIDRQGQSNIENLQKAIIGGLLLGVLLLTLASWFWVRKMLQPIANKIKKARTIGTKSLNLRLDVKNDYDELGLLALTFNEMLERIEQGFRSQQQFIRHASHEMRTPLTTITAEADLALQHGRTPEYYQKALENVREQAQNLNALISKLLIMAKVEANNNLTTTAVAVDEVLMAANSFLQHKYPNAKQRVRFRLEAQDAEQFMVFGDENILQTACFNLLDNALKYGQDKPVDVRLFMRQDFVCLEVEDYGPGMDADELKHVFEPFYRSQQSKHLPGNGIGLSLVKTIAEKYNGTISLESEPGKGTIARLLLPVYTR